MKLADGRGPKRSRGQVFSSAFLDWADIEWEIGGEYGVGREREGSREQRLYVPKGE